MVVGGVVYDVSSSAVVSDHDGDHVAAPRVGTAAARSWQALSEKSSSPHVMTMALLPSLHVFKDMTCLTVAPTLESPSEMSEVAPHPPVPCVSLQWFGTIKL